MKEKNIRRYPPIFVSVIVAVVFFAISASAIAGETNISVRAVEKGAGITYAEKTEVLENVFTASTAPAPIQTEEIEAAQTYKSVVQSRDWGAEESEMLLRIAMAEAEGESVEGKALVMLVVLNRVWSDKFPDTIEEVIFQPRQFSPAGTRATEHCISRAARAIVGIAETLSFCSKWETTSFTDRRQRT